MSILYEQPTGGSQSVITLLWCFCCEICLSRNTDPSTVFVPTYETNPQPLTKRKKEPFVTENKTQYAFRQTDHKHSQSERKWTRLRTFLDTCAEKQIKAVHSRVKKESRQRIDIVVIPLPARCSFMGILGYPSPSSLQFSLDQQTRNDHLISVDMEEVPPPSKGEQIQHRPRPPQLP